ncbi:MAG: hypothetical protein ACREHV_09225, partial [Rhizomicrobium sp.]
HRPKEFGSGWPSIVRDADDLRGWPNEDKVEYLARAALMPSRLEISRMERAFEWLRELRRQDAGLALQLMFWAQWMARRRSIRRLCIGKRWAPSTFFKRTMAAKKSIARRLNLDGDAVY